MGKIFYLKRTSKGDFANWLEHYRERNQRIGTESGYYELYQVRHTSKGLSLDSVYVGFYGEGTVDTAEMSGLITFELIQVSEDLKVIAECKDDYGLIAPITAYFLKLLHVFREEYGDAYEEPEARVGSAVKRQEPVAPQPPSTEDDTRDEETAVPVWLPKKRATCERWQKAYSIMVELKRIYREEYEDLDREHPDPKIGDYRDALAHKMGWKPSDKTTGRIKKAGDNGWLE